MSNKIPSVTNKNLSDDPQGFRLLLACLLTTANLTVFSNLVISLKKRKKD